MRNPSIRGSVPGRALAPLGPSSQWRRLRPFYGGQRDNERLTDGWVAVPGLKRLLLGVGIFASRVVAPWPAGKRQRGSTVPGRTSERRVDLDSLTLQRDGEVTVDID
jgi:hypothetical protein